MFKIKDQIAIGRAYNTSKTPKSSLTLDWTGYNGLQVVDRPTTIKNAALMPHEIDAAWAWLCGLSAQDYDAWFRAIGWIEGARYCHNQVYFKETAHACLVTKKGSIQ